MSYAIGEIIYGINLVDMGNLDPDSDLANIDADELEEFIESNLVDSAYSGNGDEPRWFGVRMGDISEGTNERGPGLIRQFTLTDEHKAAYQTKLNELRDNEEWSQALRDAVIGYPADVWLLWGSS